MWTNNMIVLLIPSNQF